MDADVLVIGAGLAGLMAANKLEEKGLKVTVLEKGRSPGGRMATRRIGSGQADHGTQFFTAHDPQFVRLVEQWVEDGLVKIWAYGFSDGSIKPQKHSSHPHYIAKDGMNALTKHLASKLHDVKTDTRIVTASGTTRGWVLQDEMGELYHGKILLMTPPVPQSLEILDEGATVLDPNDFALLSAIEYDPCLTGIFVVDGLVSLPEPGALQPSGMNIVWIGDNHRKQISPDAVVITIQASANYTRQVWSLPDERILRTLATSLEIYMQEGAKIVESQLKRWRYSQPVNSLRVGAYLVNKPALLVFAGDAFGGGQIEGAALSGIAAARKILEMQ